MGTEIHINKSALKSRGITFESKQIVMYIGCKCGQVQTKGSFCFECDTTAEEEIFCYAEVEGLDLQMLDLPNVICHAASAWGSSREKILSFINKHHLRSSEWKYV